MVVSDGFADFLDVSLTHNRPMLGHCAVVTSSADKESQRIAGKHDCTLLITDEHRKTSKFNKGYAVERGLQQLPSDGWHVHFDADILFPGNMRQRLDIGPV